MVAFIFAKPCSSQKLLVQMRYTRRGESLHFLLFLLQREGKRKRKAMSGVKAGGEFCKSWLLTLFATTGETVQRKLIVLWRELHIHISTHPDPISNPLAAARTAFYISIRMRLGNLLRLTIPVLIFLSRGKSQ